MKVHIGIWHSGNINARLPVCARTWHKDRVKRNYRLVGHKEFWHNTPKSKRCAGCVKTGWMRGKGD